MALTLNSCSSSLFNYGSQPDLRDDDRLLYQQSDCYHYPGYNSIVGPNYYRQDQQWYEESSYSNTSYFSEENIIEWISENKGSAEELDDDTSVMLDPADLESLSDSELSQPDACCYTESDISSSISSSASSTPYNVPDTLRALVRDSKDYKPAPPYGNSCSETTPHQIRENKNKRKRGAKNILLWKFLLQILEDRPDLAKWINKDKGVFRFMDTTGLSRMWGEKKRRTDMNFEKLSRGIRHYYKSGLMMRMEGKRLVYRFDWDKVPNQYRKV